MKKILGIVFICLLIGGNINASSSEKKITCSFISSDGYINYLSFYIDEAKNTIRAGGVLVDEELVFKMKKDDETISWQHSYKRKNKSFITFNYYYYLKDQLVQQTYQIKKNKKLSKEDLIGRIKSKC
ncbi:MAG: hypothetical protein ACJZ76_03375 [Candidatus Pelagibacter sp.]